MPSYNSDLFNIEPYYDDYDETKNYHKILFRPGYSVQARELTQLQTILQNQVERFGNHIFKDGSKVYGAESAIQTVNYMTVTTTSNLENFVGYEVYSGDNRAKVIHAEIIDSVTYLFVHVVRGSLPISGTVTSSIDGILANATIVSTGEAKLFSVTEGIFFIDGYFVRTGQQYAPRIGTDAGVFGFDIDRNYVGSSTDTTLLDPSRGNYNFNAPGADRFQIELDLAFHTSAERENFVPLATINASGEITNQVLYSDYSELEKALARRTYDQAGSYIVDPFELDLLPSTDNTKTQLAVGTGRAYLFGYEFENQSTEFIEIDKARTTENRSLTAVHPFTLGSYIDFSGFQSVLPSGFVDALQNGYCTTKPYPVNIIKSGNHIGSANIVSIQYADSGVYRFYLHDVQLFGNNVADGNIVLSVPDENDPTSNDSRITLVSNLGLYNATDTGLVYPVDKGSTVKTITDIKVRQRKEFVFTTDSNGTSVIDLSSVIDAENYSFVGANGNLDTAFKTVYYHLFKQGDQGESASVVSPNTYTINKLNDILTMSNLATNSSYVLLATVEFEHNTNYQSAIRKKILRRDQFTVDAADVQTDRTGRKYIALNYADIIRIRSITVTGDDTRDGVAEGESVITDFMLDNGQRDYSYEFGRLYFTKSREDAYKDEDGDYTFSLLVDYDYFEHDGKYGFLTVDSYPVNDLYVDTSEVFEYEDIPLYTSEVTGKAVSLASSIDFRFVRDYSRIPQSDEQQATTDANGNTTFNVTREEVLSSTAIPVFQHVSTRENDILQVAHEYYLPRIDKLIIRHDFNDETTKFEVLSGTPAIIPEAPADVENGLTLYRMIVPAYTHNVTDIEVEGVSHKRYTMKDIGDVDKRLEKVEVFSSLSAVESKVDETTFVAGTTELHKRAILVDDFKGHGVGDVSNDDYRCSIDFQSKELRPSFKVYDYDFVVENVDENLKLHDNGIITLDYDAAGSTFANQPKASETISVNPYQLTNWVGVIETNDAIDSWFDDETRPLVRTNTIGENDAWIATSFDDTLVGFGSQWNDWEAIWAGVQPGKKINDGKLKALLSVPRSNESLNSIRSYFERNQKIGRKTKSIGQQINEVTNTIETFPDHITKIIRDKVVDLSIVPYMRVKSIPLTVHGLKPNTTMRVYIDNTEVTDNVSGDLVSDDSGKISGLTLSIPSQTLLTGKRILRFIDSENDISTATTIAETVITAQGAFETRTQGAVSVRPIIRRKQTVNSSAVPSDVNTRKKDIRTSEKYQWIDPLAQTFFVDESEFPKGLFLQDIDLYFASKDSTLPVTVSIRPTRNGYPHPSAIIPFSEVVVYPSSVNADPDTPNTKTTVTFDAPVFLEPGEYSLCLSSNSSDYTLYTATVGATELGGSNRIQKQVYSGKLFRPQNTNIAEADYTKDLKFILRRCVFNTSGGSRDFTLRATNTGESHTTNYSRLVGSFLTPSGTGKEIVYSVTNGSVLENTNLSLPSSETIGTGDEFTYNVNFNNSIDNVSPVFDTKSVIGLQIENIINNNKSTADELKPFGTDVGASVRYITKRVDLGNETADRIRVFVDSVKSIGTDIEVYAKVKKSGDNKDFDEFSYIKLERQDELFSSDPNDIVTEEFGASTSLDDYEAFAVKVCLFSNDTNNVPRVKSIRTVALST